MLLLTKKGNGKVGEKNVHFGKCRSPTELLKTALRGEKLWSFDCGFIGEEGRFFPRVADTGQRPITFSGPAGTEVQTEPSNNGI